MSEQNKEHLNEDHVELITSDRYKSMMEQKLIDDIIREGKEDSGLRLIHVLVLLATLQVTMTIVTIWFVGGV